MQTISLRRQAYCKRYNVGSTGQQFRRPWGDRSATGGKNSARRNDEKCQKVGNRGSTSIIILAALLRGTASNRGVQEES